MRDIEQLLEQERGMGRAAADAVDLPDFGGIVRRGQRRQRVQAALVTGAAAAVVAAVIGVTQVVGGDVRTSPPVDPVTNPTETQATDPVGAPAVDAAGRAEGGLIAVVLDTGRQYELVAASREGSESIEVPEGTSVEPLPLGGYLVSRGWSGEEGVAILDDAGTDAMRDVTVAGGPRPIGANEAAFTLGGTDGPMVLELYAVDPRTAEAHPVALPEGVTDIRQIASSPGRIQGFGWEGETPTYFWSEDGGASWARAELDAGPGFSGFAEIVPSGAGAPHVVVEGGDGATVTPFVAVLQMPSDGGGFVRTEREGEFAEFQGGYVDSGTAYFVAKIGDRPPYDVVGTFTFENGRLRLLHPLPEGTDLVSAAPEGTLYVARGADLYSSSDGGRSWGPVEFE